MRSVGSYKFNDGFDTGTFSESMVIGCKIFHNLKKVIKAKFGGDATLIGDEGGFAPPCDVQSFLQMIMEEAKKAGCLNKISVGLDVASSEFKVAGKDQYDLDFKTTGSCVSPGRM